MQTIANGYRSISLLVDLNVDRLLTTSALLLALVLGGLLGSML